MAISTKLTASSFDSVRKLTARSRRPRGRGVEPLEPRVFLSTAPPAVQSITRQSPTAATISADSVTFDVTFNEPVTGVDPADFAVTRDSTVTAATPVVSPASGPAAAYTVTISGVLGYGALGLAVVSDGSIVNAENEPLKPTAGFGSARMVGAPAGEGYSTVADVNGDGRADIITAQFFDNTVGVMLSNGNGTFAAPQTYAIGTGAGVYSVAAGDVNGDGKPDLVAVNYTAGTVAVLLGNGNGTFQSPTFLNVGSNPKFAAVADLTGDGSGDIVVDNTGNGSVSVLLSNGNGTFQPQVTYATGSDPSAIAVADLNDDGKPDLIVANFRDDSISVLLGNGDGSFQPQQTFAVGTGPTGVAVEDINGDGIPDVITANYGGSNISVLLGNGDGTFASQQTFAAGAHRRDIALADVTGDGAPDVVLAGTGTLTVLPGNEDGTFETPQTFAAGTSFSIATGDVVGDGKPDIVLSSYANDVGLFLGTANPAQAYTLIKRTAVLNISGATTPFDTNAHAASAAATGTSGEDLSSLLHITYKNLADGSISTSAPGQPGKYEIYASFDGNNTYNAAPNFDTHDAITIGPKSALQSAATVSAATSPLVSGQDIKPIHVSVKLANGGSSTATGTVTVNLALSASPTGSSGNPIIATLARNVKIKAGKQATFSSLTIRSLPTGLSGTVYLILKLTDASGATNVFTAGSINVSAPLIDLAAVSLTTPTRARRGGKITDTLTITQDGNIPFSGDVPVELLLSTSASSNGAIELGSTDAPVKLKPGRKGFVHLTETIPSTLPVNSYYVISEVDPGDTLNEMNGDNGTVASHKTVAIS